MRHSIYSLKPVSIKGKRKRKKQAVCVCLTMQHEWLSIPCVFESHNLGDERSPTDAIFYPLHFIDEENPKCRKLCPLYCACKSPEQVSPGACAMILSDAIPFTLPRPIPAGKMGVVNFDLCS